MYELVAMLLCAGGTRYELEALLSFRLEALLSFQMTLKLSVKPENSRKKGGEEKRTVS